MARDRRRNGILFDRIRAALHGQERPIGAADLVRMLQKEDQRLHASLIFRALGRMVEDGEVTKVHLARGYALASATWPMWFCCSDCGTAIDVSASTLVHDLALLSSARGFQPKRMIVEVLGRCQACSEAQTKQSSNKRSVNVSCRT